MIIKFLQSPTVSEQFVSPRSLPGRGAEDRDAVNLKRMAPSQRQCWDHVAAHLDEREFELAKFAIPAIRAFHDYEDWLDFREAALFALRMAGFNVKIVPVHMTAFAHWRRRTSTSASISALDRFAREARRRPDRENLHRSSQHAR